MMIVPIVLGLAGAAWLWGAIAMDSPRIPAGHGGAARSMSLPPPRLDSGFALERALHERRSVRAFRRAPLTQAEVAQLLWAGQGITGPGGLRTAPSAGALYPLELYLVAGSVEKLDPGIYRYEPQEHRLAPVAAGDTRADLAQAALGQDCVEQAAAVLVFTAVEGRTTRKYGKRGVRYIQIEVGHAAQNVFLQATALGLDTVVVGAFYDGMLRDRLGLPPGEAPLYLMPVGRR